MTKISYFLRPMTIIHLDYIFITWKQIDTGLILGGHQFLFYHDLAIITPEDLCPTHIMDYEHYHFFENKEEALARKIASSVISISIILVI